MPSKGRQGKENESDAVVGTDGKGFSSKGVLLNLRVLKAFPYSRKGKKGQTEALFLGTVVDFQPCVSAKPSKSTKRRRGQVPLERGLYRVQFDDGDVDDMDPDEVLQCALLYHEQRQIRIGKGRKTRTKEKLIIASTDGKKRIETRGVESLLSRENRPLMQEELEQLNNEREGYWMEYKEYNLENNIPKPKSLMKAQRLLWWDTESEEPKLETKEEKDNADIIVPASTSDNADNFKAEEQPKPKTKEEGNNADTSVPASTSDHADHSNAEEEPKPEMEEEDNNADTRAHAIPKSSIGNSKVVHMASVEVDGEVALAANNISVVIPPPVQIRSPVSASLNEPFSDTVSVVPVENTTQQTTTDQPRKPLGDAATADQQKEPAVDVASSKVKDSKSDHKSTKDEQKLSLMPRTDDGGSGSRPVSNETGAPRKPTSPDLREQGSKVETKERQPSVKLQSELDRKSQKTPPHSSASLEVDKSKSSDIIAHENVSSGTKAPKRVSGLRQEKSVVMGKECQPSSKLRSSKNFKVQNVSQDSATPIESGKGAPKETIAHSISREANTPQKRTSDSMQVKLIVDAKESEPSPEIHSAQNRTCQKVPRESSKSPEASKSPPGDIISADGDVSGKSKVAREAVADTRQEKSEIETKTSQPSTTIHVAQTQKRIGIPQSSSISTEAVKSPPGDIVITHGDDSSKSKVARKPDSDPRQKKFEVETKKSKPSTKIHSSESQEPKETAQSSVTPRSAGSSPPRNIMTHGSVSRESKADRKLGQEISGVETKISQPSTKLKGTQSRKRQKISQDSSTPTEAGKGPSADIMTHGTVSIESKAARTPASDLRKAKSKVQARKRKLPTKSQRTQSGKRQKVPQVSVTPTEADKSPSGNNFTHGIVSSEPKTARKPASDLNKEKSEGEKMKIQSSTKVHSARSRNGQSAAQDSVTPSQADRTPPRNTITHRDAATAPKAARTPALELRREKPEVEAKKTQLSTEFQIAQCRKSEKLAEDSTTPAEVGVSASRNMMTHGDVSSESRAARKPAPDMSQEKFEVETKSQPAFGLQSEQNRNFQNVPQDSSTSGEAGSCSPRDVIVHGDDSSAAKAPRNDGSGLKETATVIPVDSCEPCQVMQHTSKLVENGRPHPDVVEGSSYSRRTLYSLGAHKADISPVNGNATDGCDSILLHKPAELHLRRKDDIGMFKYKRTRRNGGGALYASYTKNAPIRVFRKIFNAAPPGDVYRYDGLYSVIALLDEHGSPRTEFPSSSDRVFEFLMKRCPLGPNQNNVEIEKLWEEIQMTVSNESDKPVPATTQHEQKDTLTSPQGKASVRPQSAEHSKPSLPLKPSNSSKRQRQRWQSAAATTEEE